MGPASRAVVAGVLAGAVAVAGLTAADPPWASAPNAVGEDDGDAAAAFLAAWRRSRTSTWVVSGTFERRLRDGRTLTAEVHLAQRPPDRLTVGLGSLDARRHGHRLACATGAGGEVSCRDGGPAPAYDDEVARELDLLETYVLGPAPLYVVDAEPDGCFRLVQGRPLLTPPYGTRARFCFDPATGAPAGSIIERPEATDRVRVQDVRAAVRDQDLDPEGWKRRGPS